MVPMAMRRKAWTRSGRRLQRISEILEDNLLNGEDVLLLKTDATSAIEKLIVQHDIPKKPSFRNKSRRVGFVQESELFSLPLEILIEITTHIDTSDVENLGRTCKDLELLVNMTFVSRVVLPLSEKNMERLGGRFVLSLCSSVNIRLWGDGVFESLLKSMNLKYLKEVKFVGNNYRNVSRGGLSTGYKSILRNIFLNKKYIRKLDLSLDSSEEYYKLLERLRGMPHLEELCLRSSRFRCSHSGSKQEEKTLNQVLRNTLSGLQIRSFELKGVVVSWEADQTDYYLEIVSDSIEVLKLEYHKNYHLGAIEARKLQSLQVSTSYWHFCLYHALSMEDGYLVDDENDPPGRLVGILATGCPKLELYNGLDLKSMREKSKDGGWMSELRFHKGEGIDSEASSEPYFSNISCVQCNHNKYLAEQRKIKDCRETIGTYVEKKTDGTDEEESDDSDDEEDTYGTEYDELGSEQVTDDEMEKDGTGDEDFGSEHDINDDKDFGYNE